MSRYSIIPARFFEDERLKPSHFKVMGYLGKHSDKSGWMKLSQTKAADSGGIGMARETMCRAISDLVEWGYVDKRTKQETKRSICFYRILMDDPLEPADEVPEIGGGCDRHVTTGCDGTGHRVVTREVTTVVTPEVTIKNVLSSNIKPNNVPRGAARSEVSKSGFGSEVVANGYTITKATYPDEIAVWRRYALRRGGHANRIIVRHIDDHGFAVVPSLMPPEIGLSEKSKRMTGDAA